MDLSLTHFHLLLNHFPTIGSVIGLCLFVAALVAKSDHLKQAGLVVFAMIALLTIPAYVTGSAAEDAICVARPSDPCADPNISRSLIQAHESAAMMALLSMVITGGFAWLGLWHYRRMLHLPRWNAAVVCVSSIATLALVSRAANIGGEIRHPEIRTVQEVVGQPLARTVGNYVRDTSWVWVSGETLHFIGLTLMIGVGLLINLRTLGVMRRVPFGALDRMLLWAVLGFGVNIVTGMLFFFAAPCSVHQQRGVLLEAGVHRARRREHAVFLLRQRVGVADRSWSSVPDEIRRGVGLVPVGWCDVLGKHVADHRQRVLICLARHDFRT